MKTVCSLQKMRDLSREVRRSGRTLGFVPTMGALHEGHLSLVRQSVAACDFTVVSIFVNPAQFGENEDLAVYPEDLENDRQKLLSAGADILFLPAAADIYPPGFKTHVSVSGITGQLCGKSRPGFFRGVTTVVLKLFHLVEPDTAFFGEKDRQQLEVVKTLVRDLNLDVTIASGPIVREADGLAMSSRNRYLSATERASALCLSQALSAARKRVDAGEGSADNLRREMRGIIEMEKYAEVDYVSVCDPRSFEELEKVGSEALVALAVKIGGTRLIDNCIVGRK
jgi:pantoate--beta-alanine ligase